MRIVDLTYAVSWSWFSLGNVTNECRVFTETFVAVAARPLFRTTVSAHVMSCGGGCTQGCCLVQMTVAFSFLTHFLRSQLLSSCLRAKTA